MRQQQELLDEAVVQLERAIAILAVTRENYFGNAEPNAYHLVAGYSNCMNMFDLTYEILVNQRNILDNLSNQITIEANQSRANGVRAFTLD